MRKFIKRLFWKRFKIEELTALVGELTRENATLKAQLDAYTNEEMKKQAEAERVYREQWANFWAYDGNPQAQSEV